ncbi:integrase arm-type DNA-binding domain-containing protein [Porticoccus sp. GXU_MW_L64]
MLTDTKLRNLKPRDKMYKVVDRDGLYVAVSKAGTVSFRYNYSLNGRQETLTIGRYGVGGISLAEARERLNEAKKMIASGKSSNVFNLARRSVVPSFVAACVVYISLPFSINPVIVILPFALLLGVAVRIGFERLKKYF